MVSTQNVTGFMEEAVRSKTQSELTGCFERFLNDNLGETSYVLGETGVIWSLPGGMVGTYPDEWMDIYLRRNYHFSDPVSILSRQRAAPFFWNKAIQFKDLTKKERRVMQLARDFGLKDGVSFPIVRAGYYSAGASIIGSEMEIQEDDLPRLQLAMLYFHGCLLGLQKKPEKVRGEILLTRREIDCLSWVSNGKTDWEIGEILSISETTVHTHIENAKKKLNSVTRAQAVAEAIKVGSIQI